MHVLGVARARVNDEVLAVPQHDHEAAGADQSTAALGDELQDTLELDLPADRERHVGRRLQPSVGLLELLAAALARLIQPGVLHRDAGPLGQDHRRLLV